MIVIATDAPLDARNLKRLAARAWLGIARTGAQPRTAVETTRSRSQPRSRSESMPMTKRRPKVEVMTNDAMSPLFQAVIEATEEGVYNSMFKATTMTGNGHTVEALPIERTVAILKGHRVIK